MSDARKFKILALLIALAVFVSACGPSQPPEAAVSTAVAQTVQAGESLTQAAIQPTLTPATLNATETPLAAGVTPTTAPTLASAPSDPNCAKAALVSENPPDNVKLKPSEYFWKTWT